MKKLLTFMFSAAVAVSLMSGCSGDIQATLNSKTLVDGVYRAEYSECDEYGWKDYVEITVSEGEISEVVFDGENADKTKLKSEDLSYENQMKQYRGTYPAKYNKDLINQFIETGKIDGVDVVAGATESTDRFKTLVIAAMGNAIDGDTETVVIEN